MKRLTTAVRDFKKLPMETAREVMKRLSYKVIDRTPIDTGLLVNNWVPTKGKASTRLIKTTDKTRKKAKAKVRKVVSELKPGQNYYLTNNQPYSLIIEMGRNEGPPAQGSRQAPYGMLRLTVAEFQSIINQVVNGDKKLFIEIE